MQRIALITSSLLVAGCAVLAARGVVEAHGGVNTRTPEPTLAANEKAAHAFARHQLAAVLMPSNAVQVATDPSVAHLLDKPQSRPALDRRLMHLHRFWLVSESPKALLVWLRRHRPTGLRLSSWGRGGRDGRWVWTRGYSYRALPAGVYETELDVAIARASGRRTAVRVDSFAAGLVPRPVSEQVPATATKVEVDVRRYDGKRSYPIATVTDRSLVHRLVSTFNGFSIVQPGALLGCGLITGATPQLHFRFLSATGADIADATESGCAGLRFEVGGRSEPALQPQVDLMNLLWTERVLRVCSSLSIDAEPISRTPGPVEFILPFQIRDTGSGACGLRGYPRVTLGTATGGWAVPVAKRIPVGHPVTPPVVLLDPSWPATTSISWPSQPSCKSLAFNRVQVRLPRVPGQFAVPLWNPIDPCGTRISIAPI